ncbi:ComF family protein [Candidatus Parcubacteria bacterium]|nr:ComF family protein [Candidatus Parcubacteria bacterium]
MKTLIKKTKKILGLILDIVFPQEKIQKKINEITAEELFSKVNRTTHDDKNTIVVFDYSNELIKQSIWSLKFRNNRKISKIFAQILYDEILEKLSELKTFSNFSNPILIPIPLSKQRLIKRGFNQSELIAKEMNLIDKNSSFTFEKNILIKIKDTPPQSRTKSKQERLKNLKNCFSVKNPEKIKGRNIILLDDVTTTGTTMKEAKRTLRKYGAKKIICMAIAH